MTNTTRRSFTDEFKREAVALLVSCGRPLTQIATELGIQPSMLRSWRNGVNGGTKAATNVPGSLAAAMPSADQLEIRRLTRDLERVQMERDILKNHRGPAIRLWREKLVVLDFMVEGSGRWLFGGISPR
jgi:transposase